MGSRFSHSDDRSHINEQQAVHGYTGGKSSRVKGGSVTVHGGMTRQQNGVALVGGGHDKSYLDSLSGATVPGPVRSAPGWGNATARSGNPMVHPPGSKRTQAVRVHPNMSKGPAHDQMLADLGASILNEAVRNK